MNFGPLPKELIFQTYSTPPISQTSAFLISDRYCHHIIVRIEFSPLVEIGVNKGHYYPEETTDEGPTRVDAETGTS